MPKDLDALIDKFFPFNTNLEQSATFTPFHLLHSGDPKVLPVAGATECPCATMKESSLQACVDGTFSKSPACQWPLLSTLQGKIIFVVTGGNDHADEYVDHGRAWQQRRAFATYDHKYVTSRHFDKKTNPNGFDRVPWEVFFNQENGDSGNVFTTDCHAFPDDCKKPMQQIIFEKHLVGRSFGSGNEDDWNKQRKLKVQLIGTDLVDEADYPYASTHGLEGFPFQCALTLGDGCGTEVEARGSPVFNFTVNTEDFNNNNDPDSFAYAEQLDKKDRDYILQVSSPSGSVEDWAKACLMARSDQGARAAYFAVCRTANSTRLQVQWREATGDSGKAGGYDDKVDMDAQMIPMVKTVSTGGYAGNGIEKLEGPSFIKLTSSHDGTRFSAFGSRDGRQWHPLGATKTFKTPLVHKGIAASSHGSKAVLWRFQQFSVGVVFQNATDAATWQYWLIGDGGSPSHAVCNAKGCSFPHGPDGNARGFLFRNGWGHH